MTCLPTISLKDQFFQKSLCLFYFKISIESEVLKTSKHTSMSCWYKISFLSIKIFGSVVQISPILDHRRPYFLERDFKRSAIYFYPVKNELSWQLFRSSVPLLPELLKFTLLCIAIHDYIKFNFCSLEYVIMISQKSRTFYHPIQCS